MAKEDTVGLIHLMLTAGFSWSQVLRIAEDYLGLARGDAVAEMGDGGMDQRITKLVDWADRHGQLSRLTDGVMSEVQGNYAAQRWIASGGMPTGDGGTNDQLVLVRIENSFSRVESKVDRALEKLQDHDHRLRTLESRTEPAPINWPIIIVAVIVAVTTAAGITAMGFVR